jgi:hypothetical protein
VNSFVTENARRQAHSHEPCQSEATSGEAM